LLVQGAEKIELQRTNTRWNLTKPASYPVDGDVLNRLFEPWKGRNILRLLPTAESQAFTSSNTVPFLKIQIPSTVSGESTASNPWTMDCYRGSEETVIFHLPNRRVWGELPIDCFEHISLDVFNWRSPRVLELNKKSVIRITRTLTDEVQNFRRLTEGTAWLFNDTQSLTDAFIDPLVNELCLITVKDWVRGPTENLETFGLGTRAVRIAVGLDGDESIGKTLLIGSAAPEGGRYASLLGDESLFIIEDQTAELLLAPVMVVSHAENTSTNAAP
jgi:hypothetical protein